MELVKIFSRIKKLYDDPYYKGFAPQLAFFFILSLVPTILLISQFLLIFFESNLQQILGDSIALVDSDTRGFLDTLLFAGGGGASSSFFMFVALWAGSRALFSLVQVSNYTFSENKSFKGNYFKDRVKAILSMLFTMATFMATLAIVVYGQPIFNLLVSLFNLDILPSIVWHLIRWIFGLILYILNITFMYYFLPSIKIPLKAIFPGATLASIGILIVTLGYSTYVSNFANYSVLYGSLAGMIALFIWFYLVSWVLLGGVLYNKALIDNKNEMSNISPK